MWGGGGGGGGGGGVFFFFSSRRRHTRFTSDWSSDVCSSDLAHDKKLYRLICYVYHTAEKTMSGYIGDRPEDRRLRMYVDSDHGGDLFCKKATSGMLDRKSVV